MNRAMERAVGHAGLRIFSGFNPSLSQISAPNARLAD
jgi:hypothetical protein